MTNDGNHDGDAGGGGGNYDDSDTMILVDCSGEGFRYAEKIGLLIFLSAVILMAILGNLLVMVAVCRDRQLRKIKTNYFIVSLAFADLLVSVLVMPFGAIELVQDVWIYGEMFCLVRTSLDVLLTTASIFHLCCISLDRYYAICCQPLVYRNKMTPLRITLMLGGCWVIPMFISFLPIMQRWNNIGIIDLIEKRQFDQDSNSTYCIFMVNKPYAITCSVVAFYIPFILMVLAYYRIYITAKEHARQIRILQRAGTPAEGRREPPDQHSTHHRMKTETKAAKTLCIIMGCFCLCWAPFFVTNIIDPFVGYSVPAQLWTTFLWLGYINSGLNPFLYAFLNKAFRRAFLIILCCDEERYRRPSILGQTVPCSTTTVNGSTHVLRSFPTLRFYDSRKWIPFFVLYGKVTQLFKKPRREEREREHHCSNETLHLAASHPPESIKVPHCSESHSR
ncbi:5-hydroxytryptamine receptor 4 [Gracilinanus agilis]|uniref:5-hydroxytryptamine receptor 4 n=1 Tax=Gracilinanus agilis TaxID=191870 RepID=UPI001CFF1A63|nr:5-hydroxytryptamine receptor 4 [Gracilinanus agilis]